MKAARLFASTVVLVAIELALIVGILIALGVLR